MSFQMTLDRLLFEQHKQNTNEPILRFFYSSEPWVSVGYAGDKQPTYALSASQHNLEGKPICRRATGGGTVIHGSDLIFSLLARKQDDSENFESVETSYRHLHEVVRLAFQKLGKEAIFYGNQNLGSGRDCFLNPVDTDLRIDGVKVAGGAQKRSEDVFLHEESIQPPTGIRLEDLERELCLAFEVYFKIKLERAEINPQIIFDAEKQAGDCVVASSLKSKLQVTESEKATGSVLKANS